ncbi:MAG: hypothetical protein IBJ03_05945 [Gemmatimonadaceae bacterium]|nr:hypothetical protein [Gemmatimonadaceae bacterium]
MTAGSPSADLDFRLFDGVRLFEGGDVVRSKATQKRRLAILAYLALAPNRTASRESLIGLLWPEYTPDSARRLMAEAVYQIKKELGGDVLLSDGDQLTLLGRVKTDVERFDQAEKAGDLPQVMEVYQGPLFGTWSVGDSTQYEQWADNIRSVYARRFEEVLQRQAAGALASGDYGLARRLFARLRVDDPDSVTALEGEARALSRSGEPLQAIRLIDEFADRWTKEMAGPVPQTVLALRKAIESGKEPAGSTPVAPVEAVVAAPGEVAEPSKPSSEEATNVVVPSVDRGVEERAEPIASAAPLPVHGDRRGRGRRSWLGWPAVAAVVLAATALLWKRDDAGSVPAAAPATRVAIISAPSAASDTTLAYLRDALLSDITDQLSVNAFPVTAVSEIRAVESGRITLDSLITLRRIGTLVEMGLEGRANDLRMTVRLLDATTRGELASQRFSRPRPDALALEDDAVRFVADVLGRRMRQDIVLRDTLQATRDAYARKLLVAAVRARDDMESVPRMALDNDRAGAIVTLRSADSLLVRALAQEPAWPALLVERARLRLAMVRMTDDAKVLALLDSAVEMATAALRLSPDDPSALTVRGQLLVTAANHEAGNSSDTLRYSAAMRDLQQATALAPYRADAWLALWSVQNLRGQYEMARASARRAFENDAFMYDSERAYFALFAAAIGTSDVDDAYRWCDQGRLAHPKNSAFYLCELTLMRERPHRSDDITRARQLVVKLDSMYQNPRTAVGDPYLPIYTRVITAGVIARGGDTAQARRELEQTRGLLPRNLRKPRQSFAFDEAWVHLQLRDRARALSVLQALIREDPAMHERAMSVPLFRDIRAALPPLSPTAPSASR